MPCAPILVTGVTGQVGGAVFRQAQQRGLNIWAPTRADLDLTSASSIKRAMSENALSAVINCAAYTAVDKAESEPELAAQINAEAPAILAAETRRRGIPLIHVSTDYVFDGEKSDPYIESDFVNPINVYGKTKQAGEAAIQATQPNHAIIRTAWVLSASGANFLNTMLRLGAERAEVSVVADQFGCPTAADDIAHALLTVTQNLRDRAGTWHFVNQGSASWYELAAFIFAEASRRHLATPQLRAITHQEYPTPARRPANSQLSTAKFEKDFSSAPRTWQEAVSDVLQQRFS
ncbi:dTDP-4-dehydrorhamnose reductase [Sphingorhabdus pulchriflava]|uniref:dTDP-4-dehydrorhamnose reductase n=1 Tax=Sphingorhabdus pulchriflava TaxID=2292257 RepID=A0A371B1S8_9SPHN|nr:dTDP-4-dehydrorhamnose reductase [Sphingorhabdus pulchriflava]RDV01477.1 dTDP-4-dehydrorhamnose reductase [Sphingorhabdus pulchriflava]